MITKRTLGLTAVLCMPLVVQGCATELASHRVPGTESRPSLSAPEAAPYTAENYFARGACSVRSSDPGGQSSWKTCA